MRRAAAVSHWTDRIARYRADGARSWPRVVGFVALRIGALTAYACGVLWSFIDERDR